MLNNALPLDIRVIGWSEVTPEFSARFSAANRSYRYFFVRKNRDIAAMKKAASLLLGEHDFRNFCKIDLGNVSNFRREIYYADVNQFSRNAADEFCDVWMLELTGVAFLWHMVRCIMSVLFMVGEGHEDASVISELLAVDTCPAKPVYSMAPEFPLVLHSCGYDNLEIGTQLKTLWNLAAHFESLHESHVISATRAENALRFLFTSKVSGKELIEFIASMNAKSAKRGKSKEHAAGNVTPNISEQEMEFSTSLKYIFDACGAVPRLSNGIVHVPLMQV